MSTEEITSEALRLPERARAELVQHLLRSFEGETDDSVEEAWTEEAERRFAEMKDGKVDKVSAEEMFQNVLGRLKKE